MLIGFIGAGRMGRPMVRRLLVGHQIQVLVRSSRARMSMIEDGVPIMDLMPSTAAAAQDADVVVVCLYSDEQVRKVCLTDRLLDRMEPGATLVVHTTCDPGTIEELVRRGRSKGIEIADAALSGGPGQVERGELTIFLGAADDVADRVIPVLQMYSSVIRRVGSPGFGQRVKLVNNALFGAGIGLVSDAVRLGESIGLSESVVLDALRFGSADSWALRVAGDLGSVRSLAEAAGPFVDKDRAVVAETAERLGGDLGLLADAADRFSNTEK